MNKKEEMMKALDQGYKFETGTDPDRGWAPSSNNVAGQDPVSGHWYVNKRNCGSTEAAIKAMEEIAPLGEWKVVGD